MLTLEEVFGHKKKVKFKTPFTVRFSDGHYAIAYGCTNAGVVQLSMKDKSVWTQISSLSAESRDEVLITVDHMLQRHSRKKVSFMDFVKSLL